MAKQTITLDISNPSIIEAKSDKLQILILGQIDTTNLDSLSVVLKISKLGKQTPPIRQSLDLYREERVEMLIDTICKKLEIGFAETQSIVYELIEQLESYRFKLIENNKQFEASSNLSSKDKQSAKRYLGKKNVIESIKSDLEKSGIYSHNNEALLLYLSIASRKLENPLSICFLDDSEVSKNLFDVIKNCTPESEYIYPSSISSQALYYLGLDDFKHKTMFLSEFGSKQDIHAPLAQLIKEKELVKIVALKDKTGMPYTMNPIVHGPINLNTISKYKFKSRIQKLPLLTIPIETSEEDINKWMYAKKMASAGLINYQERQDARNRLINLQAVLQPIKTINPFAVDIELPDSHKGDSKLLNHLLRLIETITYLNQFQREQYVQDAFGNPTESYIKTEKQDIELAFELLAPMFEIKPSLLHPKTQDFYAFLKSWLNKHGLEEFKSYQIRQSNPSMVKRSVNRYLKELLENGLLEIVSGTKNTGYTYVLKGLQFNTDIENSFSLNDFVKGIFND